MKKKKNEPERGSPGTLDVLTALIGEHNWLDLLQKRDPKSDGLVAVIHELGSEEEYKRPSVKELAAKLGMPGTAVTKMIHGLYEAIWELNHEHPELFGGAGSPVTCFFYDKLYGGSEYFTLWLDQPVRVGESFDWYFIRPKHDNYGYYVDEVSHEYRNGRQVVSVFLKGGRYNGYLKMLFEKAQQLRLLSFDELYSLRDFELEHLLVHRVEKDRAGFPEDLSYLNKHKY